MNVMDKIYLSLQPLSCSSSAWLLAPIEKFLYCLQVLSEVLLNMKFSLTFLFYQTFELPSLFGKSLKFYTGFKGGKKERVFTLKIRSHPSYLDPSSNFPT